MFDLHQGFTNPEQPERAGRPNAAAVLLAQIDVVSSLLKGRLRDAAVQQARAARLLARLAADTLAARLGRG